MAVILNIYHKMEVELYYSILFINSLQICAHLLACFIVRVRM